MGMKRSGIIYPSLPNATNLSISDYNSNLGNVSNISEANLTKNEDLLGEDLLMRKYFSDNATQNSDLVLQDLQDQFGIQSQDTISDTFSENSIAESVVDSQTSEDDYSSRQNTYNDQARITNDLRSNEYSNRSIKNYTGHKEFVVKNYGNSEKDSVDWLLQKLQKSPYSGSNNNQRKFASGKTNNDNGYGSSDKKRSESFRQIETTHSFSADKREGGSSIDSDSGGIDRRYSLLTMNRSNSKRNALEKDSKPLFRKSFKSKDRNAFRKESSKKEKITERKEKSDGMLFSLMFIFEIFRWFTGTDIIVRFVVAAIAGIVGFGIIFSQVGALSSF